jgi:hypothetical protein
MHSGKFYPCPTPGCPGKLTVIQAHVRGGLIKRWRRCKTCGWKVRTEERQLTVDDVVESVAERVTQR